MRSCWRYATGRQLRRDGARRPRCLPRGNGGRARSRRDVRRLPRRVRATAPPPSHRQRRAHRLPGRRGAHAQRSPPRVAVRLCRSARVAPAARAGRAVLRRFESGRGAERRTTSPSWPVRRERPSTGRSAISRSAACSSCGEDARSCSTLPLSRDARRLSRSMTERPERAGTGQPRGTVTFLFSDIEGSTRLLQALGSRVFGRTRAAPNAAAAGIPRARRIRGRVRGDQFFVAFQHAGDAVAAAAEAQQLLAHEPWPGGCELRVRIGLHSGESLLAPPVRRPLRSHCGPDNAPPTAAGHPLSGGTGVLLGRPSRERRLERPGRAPARISPSRSDCTSSSSRACPTTSRHRTLTTRPSARRLWTMRRALRARVGVALLAARAGRCPARSAERTSSTRPMSTSPAARSSASTLGRATSSGSPLRAGCCGCSG